MPASWQAVAVARKASLIFCAPEDPPVTTSTGRSSRSPRSARNPARCPSSLRSRSVISVGMGMPTRVELRSSVSGKVMPTRPDVVSRAPRRLAIPGFALASWTMSGIFACLAARNAGGHTYPPTPTTASMLREEMICLTAEMLPRKRPGNFSRAGLIDRGMGTLSMVSSSNPARGTISASSPSGVPSATTSQSGCCRRSSRPIASIGEIWPVVPPPARRILVISFPFLAGKHGAGGSQAILVGGNGRLGARLCAGERQHHSDCEE